MVFALPELSNLILTITSEIYITYITFYFQRLQLTYKAMGNFLVELIHLLAGEAMT